MTATVPTTSGHAAASDMRSSQWMRARGVRGRRDLAKRRSRVRSLDDRLRAPFERTTGIALLLTARRPRTGVHLMYTPTRRQTISLRDVQLGL